MAQLPPKPSMWRRGWFRLVIEGVSLVVVVGVTVLLWHWLHRVMQTDDSLDANTWVGLVGSLASAVLGGLAAVGVLLLTLKTEQRKRAEEDRRQVVERRLDLADELGDLVGTMNVGDGLSLPEISVKALQAGRLVRKIDRTWADQHEGRHVSIALFNGVQAFREIVDAGLTDDSLTWLRKQLFSAIENLTSSMAHREQYIVATDATALLQVVETKPTSST